MPARELFGSRGRPPQSKREQVSGLDLFSLRDQVKVIAHAERMRHFGYSLSVQVHVMSLFGAHPQHGVTPIRCPFFEAIFDDHVIECDGLSPNLDHAQNITTCLTL